MQTAICIALLVGLAAGAYPAIASTGILAVTDIVVAIALIGALLILRGKRYRRARRVVIERGAADLAELRHADRRHTCGSSLEPVISRAPRPRVQKLNAQRISTRMRFWKPIRYQRWTNSQVIQAISPLSLRPLTSATAEARPMVARFPLSR